MRESKLKKVLANTTMSCLLMSSVIPYNVLATTSTPIDPIRQEASAPQLTNEQIAALNKISIAGTEKISSKINTLTTEPVRVIVEFKQAPAKIAVMQEQLAGNSTTLKEETSDVNNSHKQFRAFVDGLSQHKAGVSVNAVTAQTAASEEDAENSSDIQITSEYKSALNGVAMTLPGNMVESLFESGLVSHVLSDEIVKLDPSELGQVKQQSEQGEAPKENTIPLPGIDALHNEGIKGNGVKVGVLDTGIDYNHPDLTDVYKGFRKQEGVDPSTISPSSVKGWDFVDNDADPMETTPDDWVNAGKPVTPGHTYETYHGTHVSGTIAAQSKANVENPAQGVAPGVDLYAYRVLGPYGSGYTSGILGGIDKSVSDGMKVINMSLGAPSNDPLSAEAIAVNNATLAGVTCVISAGNSGPKEYTLGTPGAAALPITVGASDFPMSIPTATATVGNETFTNFKLLGKGYNDHVEALANKTYPVVFVGLGGADDVKDLDLHGKVALIKRGTYALSEKIVNAQKAGAVAAIMYNNIDGDIDNYLASDIGFIPTFRLSKADGERLKAAAETASITFTEIGSTVTEGNHLAAFSSRGPVTTSYDIKPDVVAPGVSVYSTYPEYIHSPEPGIDYSQAYARISGTSMASPHVAGIAALILQAHPDYTPFDVKTALTNTADKMNGNYSVYEVGAGLVDVAEAVHADVSFKVQDTTQIGNLKTVNYEKGSLTFGSVYQNIGSSMNSTRTVKVTNRGSKDKTFDLSYEFIKPNSNVNDGAANNVTVTTPASVTVSAGQTTNFNAAITIPGSAQFGRYEGYVNIVNHDNPSEHFRIPFAARMVEKGFSDLLMDNNAASTRKPVIPSFFNFGNTRNIGFKLNSPMKWVWATIYDKNGNALGAVFPSPISASTAPTDRFLSLSFDAGSYYPFIGDPAKELTSQFTKASLPEGDYTIKFRATDTTNMYAKTYEKSMLFIVDNQLPKLTYKDHAPGLYELSDSDFTDEEMGGNMYHSFWVHANLYDEGTAKLAPLGIDQSSNNLFYYYNAIDDPAGQFKTDANGDTKFGIEKSDIENGPAVVTLFPRDVAGNAELVNDFHQYVFVKKGTPYMVPTYDKQKAYLNDTVTMTLNLHNVQQMMSGTYNATYFNTNFDLQGVTVAPEFQKWADDHGVKVNVDTPVGTRDPVYLAKTMINVGAHLSGGEDFKGFSGDEMPFLNVTLKVNNDDPTTPAANILYSNMVQDDVMTNFSMMQYGQTQPTNITAFNRLNSFQLIPTHNSLKTFVRLEAFANNYSIDYTTLKANAYALLSDGSKYPGTIDPQGFVYITGIPLSKDPFKVIIEAPGHLKSVQTITMLGQTPWGDNVGQYAGYIGATSKQPNGPAGDLNGDGVIDVLDVKKIANKIGMQDQDDLKVEDLNQDGIINETDMKFLVKNLYKSNFDATVKPKEQVAGKYSTHYFNELGIASTVNTLKNTTISKNTAALSWIAAVNATEVKIEQSNDNGATWTNSTTSNPVTADSSTAVVTGLTENTSYKFRVRVTGGLNGGISNVVSVNTVK